MNDALTSLIDHLNNRAKTQIYGVFALWWLLLHSSFFVALIVVDQSLIYKNTGLLKDQYLQVTYFNLASPEFWVRFFLPFLLTYLTMWWFPKWILNRAYRQERDNEYARQKIKYDYQREIEELRGKVKEEKVKTLKNEEQVINLEENLETRREKIWAQEYEEFKTVSFYRDFDDIQEAVLLNYGQFRGKDPYNKPRLLIDSNLLAFADSSELILIDQENDTLELTEKGRYFMKRYQLDKHKNVAS